MQCENGEIRIGDDAAHPMLVTVSTRKIGPVPAGAVATLPFQASLPWAARSFFVPSDIAPHFDLMSMRCARVEWISDDGEGVPCTQFSGALCGECRRKKVYQSLPRRWPVVQVGMILYMVVRNKSDLERHFEGTFEAVDAAGVGSCL